MDPRPRAPRRADSAYHHGDLRNALLREGRALIESIGPAELSLREIARRVGVSEAAPSRHFEDKAELLANLATEGFRELIVQRRAILAQEAGPLETVRRMMRSYVRYAQQNKGIFNLMVGPRLLDRSRHVELATVGSASLALFTGAAVALARANGWPKRQVDLVAHSAWAMEHGLATLILADRAPAAGSAVTLESMIDFAIDMMLSALVAGPPGLARVRGPAKRPRSPATKDEAVTG